MLFNVLYFTYYKDTMEASDAIKISKTVQNQFLIMLHAADMYLHLIIIVSGSIVTLHNLVYFRDYRCELPAELPAVKLQTNIA